jgi:hypothetical protein
VSNTHNEDIHVAIQNVAGVQFTVIFILVFTATFVPKGAFAMNPKMLSDEELDDDIFNNDGEDGESIFSLKERVKTHDTQTTRRNSGT